MAGYSWEIDEFDTKILGFKCAKIRLLSDSEKIGKLLSELRRSRVQYAIHRVGAENFPVIHALENSGFLMVDGSVSLMTPLDNLSEVNFDTIREASSDDALRVADIAYDSFQSTRFFNDPLIPIEKAREIYRQWALNSLEKKSADNVFVSVRNGEIAGFITVESSHIPLISVHTEYRGKGIGRELVSFALNYIRKNGGHEAFIETQVNNIAALRAYQACGFTIRNAYFTFRISLV